MSHFDANAVHQAAQHNVRVRCGACSLGRAEVVGY